MKVLVTQWYAVLHDFEGSQMKCPRDNCEGVVAAFVEEGREGFRDKDKVKCVACDFPGTLRIVNETAMTVEWDPRVYMVMRGIETNKIGA